MTEIAFQSRKAIVRHFAWPAFAASAAVCLLVSGCATTRKKPAFPWSTASIVRPIIPAPSVSEEEAAPAVQGETAEALPPIPSSLAPAPSSPVRPRTAPPPNSGSERLRADPPVLAPQMSAEETAAAQQDTNLSLGEAERNLASTHGKNL